MVQNIICKKWLFNYKKKFINNTERNGSSLYRMEYWEGKRMGGMVSVSEKKDFLKWFLNSYQLKRRECAWLLNFLLSDDKIMEKVHFVKEAEYCPKGMIISTVDVDNIPFCYYRNNRIVLDTEKAFHDIRLNKEEDVYIQLNFPNAHLNSQYFAVLETNPFSPSGGLHNNVDRLEVEQLIAHVMKKFRKEQLLKEIDQALDKKDKERFIELTNQLKNESY